MANVLVGGKLSSLLAEYDQTCFCVNDDINASLIYTVRYATNRKRLYLYSARQEDSLPPTEANKAIAIPHASFN